MPHIDHQRKYQAVKEFMEADLPQRIKLFIHNEINQELYLQACTPRYNDPLHILGRSCSGLCQLFLNLHEVESCRGCSRGYRSVEDSEYCVLSDQQANAFIKMLGEHKYWLIYELRDSRRVDQLLLLLPAEQLAHAFTSYLQPRNRRAIRKRSNETFCQLLYKAANIQVLEGWFDNRKPCIATSTLLELTQTQQRCIFCEGHFEYGISEIARSCSMHAGHRACINRSAMKCPCEASTVFQYSSSIQRARSHSQSGFVGLPLELQLEIADFLCPADRLRLASTCRNLELHLDRIELRNGWSCLVASRTSEDGKLVRDLKHSSKSILLHVALSRDEYISQAQRLLEWGSKVRNIHQLLEDTFRKYGYGPQVRLLIKRGGKLESTPSGAQRLLEDSIRISLRPGDIAWLVHANAVLPYDSELQRFVECPHSCPYLGGAFLFDKTIPLKWRLECLLTKETHLSDEEFSHVRSLIASLDDPTPDEHST